VCIIYKGIFCSLKLDVTAHFQVMIRCCGAMQERLAALLPGLAVPMHGDCETTFMQWGLASVRSRAFQLKERDCFAFVPFLDIANHAPQPNSAFRKSTLRNSDSAAAIELVAVADIKPGQEAVISYTERKGCGLRAQHSFHMMCSPWCSWAIAICCMPQHSS
jgi:hypothetical protein